ncbi:MAG: N-acetylmuramoyl-L-alanine amidase [Clostridia bacterium]|nr:N-acetylmuramoyl-L-alanine amidase [Clostridia bacterium]
MNIAGIALTGALLLSFSGVVSSFVRPSLPRVAAVETALVEKKKPRVLVIDPGHGGGDGGAVAPDGTTEKDIDLAVAKDIDALSLLFGIPAVMTRTEDELLSDRYPGETGGMKARDLKGRLRVAKEADAALLLSIHANKFPDESVRGIQVFYSPNGDESRRAAGMIQEYVNANLQPDHVKETKRANSSIYLLDRAKVPAVLAECGFLSNGAELAALKTEEYRASVACAVFAAAAEYLSN